LKSAGTGLGIDAFDFELVGFVTTEIVRESVTLFFIID